MRRILISLAATALLVAALPAVASAATTECPTFTVVRPDPDAGLPAGRYHRLNFSPRNTLTCDDTYHVLRSYLYDPETHRGWTVGKLVGRLKSRTGKRFVKTGTRGRVGFDLWK